MGLPSRPIDVLRPGLVVAVDIGVLAPAATIGLGAVGIGGTGLGAAGIGGLGAVGIGGTGLGWANGDDILG